MTCLDYIQTVCDERMALLTLFLGIFIGACATRLYVGCVYATAINWHKQMRGLDKFTEGKR